LKVFPPDVARTEVAFYKKVMQPYGVPLDSRTRLTKTDWSFWCASLAENQEDFAAIIAPVYDYLNKTTARVALVDSYTTDNIASDGMHARPVVGGLFIKMLNDPVVWKKWAGGDKANVSGWAPLPEMPQYDFTEVVPTSRLAPVLWRHTTTKPPENWAQTNFDASSWPEGPGTFGTKGTPGAVVRTVWNTDDIWLRREIVLPPGRYANLVFYVDHDEDVEIYVNGVLAASEDGYTSGYVPLEINKAARPLLEPGARVVLAVHCHQTTGGQNIDVGLANARRIKSLNPRISTQGAATQ
jgi:hypothetical protein